jgi:hypothetical protein
VIRFGDVASASAKAAGSVGCQRLTCTCAPVHDYTGREVARVGLFAHDVTEDALLAGHHRGAWELARLISQRLGSVAAPAAVADSA